MRPIVSGIGALGEQLGIRIDHHLQPLVFDIPGYLQDADTKHLVSVLDHHPGCWNLVGCRAKWLVFIHPYHKILRWLFYANSWTNIATIRQKQEFLVRATDFLLYHNYLCFNGEFFFSRDKEHQWGCDFPHRFC